MSQFLFGVIHSMGTTFLTRSFSLIIILWFILSSCSSENGKSRGLYNIDSLVEAQAEYLLAHKATLIKKAILDDAEKVSASAPKSIAEWENELAVFSELNVINKPLNKAAYKIEDQRDTKSNLKIKSFVTTEKIGVQYLKLYYQQSPDRIRKIEAKYHEGNSLYSSARFLTMEFNDDPNKTILTSYSIEGGQKMVLDDSVRYHVNVTVSLKD